MVVGDKATSTSRPRLLSLDFFRGFTVAAMILVKFFTRECIIDISHTYRYHHIYTRLDIIRQKYHC